MTTFQGEPKRLRPGMLLKEEDGMAMSEWMGTLSRRRPLPASPAMPSSLTSIRLRSGRDPVGLPKPSQACLHVYVKALRRPFPMICKALVYSKPNLLKALLQLRIPESHCVYAACCSMRKGVRIDEYEIRLPAVGNCKLNESKQVPVTSRLHCWLHV